MRIKSPFCWSFFCFMPETSSNFDWSSANPETPWISSNSFNFSFSFLNCFWTTSSVRDKTPFSDCRNFRWPRAVLYFWPGIFFRTGLWGGYPLFLWSECGLASGFTNWETLGMFSCRLHHTAALNSLQYTSLLCVHAHSVSIKLKALKQWLWGSKNCIIHVLSEHKRSSRKRHKTEPSLARPLAAGDIKIGKGVREWRKRLLLIFCNTTLNLYFTQQ